MEKRFTAQGEWSVQPIDPEKFILACEVMKAIEKCLETLPLSQRMAFSLREIEYCSSKEICEIMGITPSNLGVLQYRARNRLRECIEKKADFMEKR